MPGVWGSFWCPLFTGTYWSVANASFLCFRRKRKVWLLLSPFWKTSEPSEIPRILSQPYILVNFQESSLRSKTCMPWHVIKAFSVRYNQCHFVETLSVQLCLPPSPTRQCWKKVSTKLMKTSAHNTMQHWIGEGGEGVSTTCVTGCSLRWGKLYKVVIQLLRAKLVALCPFRKLHPFFAGNGASSQSLSSL